MGRIIIPYLNPLNLVEVAPVEIPQYVTKFIDDYLWSERLQPQQMGVKPFYQLWQNSDVIPIQLQSDMGQITVYVINCKRKQIDSFIMTPKQQNKYEPGMYIYEAFISLTPYPPGKYMLVFKVGDSALVSEPIHIKARHENTFLFQYKHRNYRGNVIFETGIEMNVRAVCNIKLQAPQSKDTLYEDQVLDMTLIKSVPFTVYDLTIEQIPDWYSKIFGWVMGCSSVRINGHYFTKNGEGAKFEKEVKAYYDALANYKLELRDSTNRNSKVFSATENTNEELTITLNVDSKGFADTSVEASSSVVTFLNVE